MIRFIHIAKNAGSSIERMIKDGKLQGIQYGNNYSNSFTITDDQLIILRDPFDRFCSAFYFDKLDRRQGHDYIKTPNELAERLLDHDEQALNFVKMGNQWVGDVSLGIDWIYYPQKYWVNCPKYVLFYDNLKKDFEIFLNQISHPQVELLHVNKSVNNKETSFSPKGKEFIYSWYKDDFSIIDFYKNGRNF